LRRGAPVDRLVGKTVRVHGDKHGQTLIVHSWDEL
jgi:hypothetical protein